MPYGVVDAIKDLCGAAGPALIAIPWFQDFKLKEKLKFTRSLNVTGPLRILIDEVADSFKHHLENPRASDLWWTLGGLALIFLSFVISLANGLWSNG